MATLPLLTAFSIKDFNLFPGVDGAGGIARPVEGGVTLVAGINGLGKTTRCRSDLCGNWLSGVSPAG